MLKHNCCHPEFAVDGDKCTLCDKVLLDNYDLVLTTHVWRLGRTNWDDAQEKQELTRKVRIVPDYSGIVRYSGLQGKRTLLIMPNPLTKDEQRMFEFAKAARMDVMEV